MFEVLSLTSMCCSVVAENLQAFQHPLSTLPEEVLLLVLEKLQEMGSLQESKLSMLLHPQLRALCLAKCMNEELKISDKIFSHLPYSCPNLTHLRVVPDHEITTPSLSRILRKCSRLVSLEVTDQSHLEDIVGTTVEWAGANLRQLSLVRCKYVLNSSLLFLSKQCGKNLELLNLKGCSQFNEGVLYEVICNCPKLQYLNLSDGEHVTNHVVKAIADCTSLKSLNLNWAETITESSILNLCRSITGLMSLKLRRCAVTDKSILQVAETYNSSLTVLDVQRCELLEEKTAYALATYCPNLRKIDLSWMFSLSDTGLANLLEKGTHLRKVRLEGCKMLTNNAIAKLPEYVCGQKLEILDLSWCDFFTTSFLSSLAAQVQKVRLGPTKLRIVDYYGETVSCNNLEENGELTENISRRKLGLLARLRNEMQNPDRR